MKYLTEYRSSQTIKEYLKALQNLSTKKWTIMEICGGQTHNILKFGLNQSLDGQVNLVHGPGCPVCVTPAYKIDYVIELSNDKEVIVCSFGDMLRVPGSYQNTLLKAKALGACVKVVYSPLEALQIAKDHSHKEIVFFAVGFETTAPANALAIYMAAKQKIKNFSVIVSHVLVPPAIKMILSHPNCQIDGFLAAGHVCTVMGYQDYHELAHSFQVPIVITGFEPVDILEGISRCVQMLESKQVKVENQYARSVSLQGNLNAKQMLKDVFVISDMVWRGIGNIPDSGLILNDAYQEFNAEQKFKLKSNAKVSETTPCRAHQVLLGTLKPCECPYFAKTCRPEHPMGAPMVSSEGACAAYFHFTKRGK